VKKSYFLRVFILFGILSNLLIMCGVFAANRTVNLVVGYKTVYFAGKTVKAMAANDQIPAPTLHFNEGDHVTINVYNHLDQETAIHWHGMLVPWQMDGVLGITQQGIPPGGVFHYQFTLYQSGTYWYHAHAGLQEQQGLYGAFLIDPPKQPSYKYTKDYVVVLSDWSNTHPDQILANLKKEGDYYSPKFPLQPSLVKFIHDYRKASTDERQRIVDDYKMMQQMRMSIYDISDVAYDAFLLNGQPNSNPWTAPVRVGDVVRLRFIGAGGSTIFHVKIPNTTMQMVHVDGNDVKPYAINEFKIAPGETFDVLVKIQKNDPYIIYAESIDTLGAAYGALVTSPHQFVNYQQVTPFPEPLPVMRDMMSLMMEGQGSSMKMNHSSSSMGSMKMEPGMKMGPSMQMGNNMPMNHSMHMNSMSKESMKHMSEHQTSNTVMSSSMKMGDGMQMNHAMSMHHSHDMSMPTEPSVIGDAISLPNSFQKTIGTKYQNLTAAVKTNDPNKPVNGVIKMELFGYMDRYIWFINGVPEYKAHPIVLKPNKRYRFIFTNPSMMRHPMHIHGHWFILRNGHGSFDPLLHTIDIPPGATVTADLDTDASGQWLFHCHLLYHMMTGMSRVFQYSTLIEITHGEAKPQHFVKQTSYYNRPIVRIDEVRPIDTSLVRHPMAHHMGLYLANFLEVGEDPFHNAQRLTFKGLYGRDYNKLELFANDAEVYKGKVQNADLDIFYWHLLSQFWAIKGGTNYFYQPAKSPYWQLGIGIEGLMPYFIDTNIRGYAHSGSAKLDAELSRDSQMTNNFFIRAEIRGILASKTVTQAQIGSGLNQMRYIVRPYYRIMPGLNIFAEYEYERDYGSFRNIQVNNGESATQNTLTFGLSMVF
jgi:CopA family copper-resistance protein